MPSTTGSRLPRARQIALAVHRHQRDLAGKPYLGHVYRVMRAVPERLRVVACLHDVIEDGGGEWTLDRLEAEGFEPWVLAALDALTRRPGERYRDYIERVAANEDARVVKLADLADNLDPRRSIPESLRRRYEVARRRLSAEH